MIAHINGVVAEKFASSVIVDVHGVGYEIQVPANDYESAQLNQPVKFYTYHHIREQSQELFGFSSLEAKQLFELLITVQGVGPKAAIAILSLSDAASLRSVIASGDSAFLARAGGIGKRIAERITVDLADKVGAGLEESIKVSRPSGHDEALEALMSLGFGLNDAARALSSVPVELNTSERVTAALKVLGGGI